MVTKLQEVIQTEAARWVPIFITVVNGSAPLIISLWIIAPYGQQPSYHIYFHAAACRNYYSHFTHFSLVLFLIDSLA
jgi:hypothetical protein